MTKSTDRALGLLAAPTMMHSDKWINQHTIRACDFIYGTYERSGGRFWQMSFLANWFCCRPEARTVMAPLSALQMDGELEPNGCPHNFCTIGEEQCKRLSWHWRNKDIQHRLALQKALLIVHVLENPGTHLCILGFYLFIFFKQVYTLFSLNNWSCIA